MKEMLKAKYGFGAQLASPHASREGQDPLSPTSDTSESGAFSVRIRSRGCCSYSSADAVFCPLAQVKKLQMKMKCLT